MVQALTGDSLQSFLLPSELDCPDRTAIDGCGNLSKPFTWAIHCLVCFRPTWSVGP